jgi:hypothetical protein
MYLLNFGDVYLIASQKKWIAFLLAVDAQASQGSSF